MTMNLEKLADQVLAIDTSHSRAQVLLDLEFTKCVETTINRIFDGQFLQGVQPKPKIKGKEKAKVNAIETMIILDSDDEEEPTWESRKKNTLDIDPYTLHNSLDSIPSSQKIPKSPTPDYGNQTPPPPIINLDSLEDLSPNRFASPQSLIDPIKPFNFSDDEDSIKKKTNSPNRSASIVNTIEDELFSLSDEDKVSNKQSRKRKASPKRSASFTDTIEDNPYSFQLSDDDDEITNKPSRKRKASPKPVGIIEDDPYSFQLSDDDDEITKKPSRKKKEVGIIEDDPFAFQLFDDDDEISKKSSKIRKSSPDIFASSVGTTIEDNPYSFQLSDDDDDGELTEKPSRKRSTSTNNISLVDSDSDGSLPSMDDFFDKLMCQKKTNRKGKQRAYDYNTTPFTEPVSEPSSAVTSDQEFSSFSLSSKEQKKLDSERRKQIQSEEKQRILEEKKQKRLEVQEEKKRLKEQKLLEKNRTSLLERENRIKSDRVKTIKEMIVEMHPDFLKTSTGELTKMILEKKESIVKSTSSSNLYSISWKRKCTSEWDENEMIFVPFEKPKIVQEPFVLVYIDVYDFINYIQLDTMDDYIDKLQTNTNSRQLILLVEGLHAYYKKKINLQRRIFDEQIRSSMEGSSTSSRRRNQPEVENGPNQEEVELCIDHLMLERGVMFLSTKKDEDSASWIESLTTDLALGRYKSKNANNSYKVGKRGSHPNDTYSKMLQEIQLCTPTVAKSVIQAYPTLSSLSAAYKFKRPSEAEKLLSDLEVERSTLTARDRKINRVMSKKIYTIFNSTDPDELIS